MATMRPRGGDICSAAEKVYSKLCEKQLKLIEANQSQHQLVKVFPLSPGRTRMTGKTSPFANVASSSDLQDKATDLQEQLEHIMEEEFPDIFRRTIKSQPSQPSCQGATATAETVDANPTIPSTVADPETAPTLGSNGFNGDSMAMKTPVQPKRLTQSLMEGLDFARDFVLMALVSNNPDYQEGDELGLNDLESLRINVTHRTTSIAFAGVAAHDVVDRLLAENLSALLQKPVQPPRSLWHIEYNEGCKQELLLFHDKQRNPAIYGDGQPEPCLFQDINSFWRPEVVDIVESCRKKPWLACEVLADLLVSGRAVRLSGWCVRHQKYCRAKCSSRHSSGSVCVAYSTQGLQLGLSDPSVLSLLCWNLC